MLGQEAAYDRVPYFYSDQYDLGHGVLRLRRAGRLRPRWCSAASRLRCDGEAPEFVAFWVDRTAGCSPA